MGCELYKNAFGRLAPPGPIGGAIALREPLSRYKGEKRERRIMKGLGIVEKGRKGTEERDVNG